MGAVCSIKNRWLRFDGTVPHFTLPFKGERFSVVLFVNKQWDHTILQRSSGALREQLLGLGFRPPGPPTGNLAQTIPRIAIAAPAPNEDSESDEAMPAVAKTEQRWLRPAADNVPEFLFTG